MRIQLNGTEHEVCAGTTVAELILEAGLPPEQVAVEINRELVPRADRAARPLAADDRVESVTLVGGG